MYGYEIGNSIIENVVSKLIQITIENSTEGNYIFDINDIKRISKIDCSNEIFEAIEDSLWDRDEVADVQISDKEIDILIWGENL